MKIKNIEDFKQMLFRGYRVENNPKKEQCFKVCWEIGNKKGYNEVERIFSILSKLIKKNENI
jgi:hypothetical protein